MDAYVVKVQFGDSLRRISLEGGDLAFSYAQLVTRTKELFQIPATAQPIFTYTDRDGDVVTMAEDQDLRDALVTQALNPLRLNLALVTGETKNTDVRMNDSTVEPEANPTSEDGKTHKGIETQHDNGEKGDAARAAATPNKKSPKTSDTGEPTEQVVHRGITCDDCGTTPITGPRYKSMTTEDFDLCRDCFEKPGVDSSDYIKIKRGRPDRRSVHFARGFGRGFRSEPRHGRDSKGFSRKSCEDGRWEQQSAEAVHHGVECDECRASPIVGPRFKSEKRYNYDLCQNCFQNFASTSSSDEYTRIDQPVRPMPRYYRLVSPYSFYRFSPYGRPFCGRRIRRIVVTTVSDEEQEERRPNKSAAAANKSGVAPAAQEAPGASTDVKMSDNDDGSGARADNLDVPEKQAEIVAGNGEVAMAEAGGEGPSSEGNKNEAPTENATGEQEQERPATEAAAEGAAGEVSTHEGMVAKLAAMGFNDSKLNEELLKKNNFDLRSTLDELCAVKNWDPILDQLREMGFGDSELNKRLLAQNDGNVRAAVRELVRLTKEEANASVDGEKRT